MDDEAGEPTRPGSASEVGDPDGVMYGLSAILKTQPGKEDVMERALRGIVEHVRDNEPGTIEYYVARDLSDPTVFTTYERYISQEAMDAHNGSPETAQFYETINPILDGKVILVEAKELVAKQVGDSGA